MRAFALILLAFFSKGALADKPREVVVFMPKENAANLNRARQLRCIFDDFRRRWSATGSRLRLSEISIDQEPASTLEAAQHLARTRPDLVIGTMYSSEAIAAASVLDPANVPFLVGAASNPEITRGRKNVLQLAVSDTSQAAMLAKTASHLKAARVLVVRNLSEPYSVYLADSFSGLFKRANPASKLEMTDVLNGTFPIADVKVKLDSLKPDLVFAPLYHQHLAPLYATVRESGLELTLLGSDTVGGEKTFLDMLGQLSKKVRFLYANQWNRQPSGPFAAEFEKIQKANCPDLSPTLHMASLYDALKLAEKSHARLSGLRAAHMNGITGPVSFAPGKSDLARSLALFEINQDRTSTQMKVE